MDVAWERRGRRGGEEMWERSFSDDTMEARVRHLVWRCCHLVETIEI